MDFLPICKQDMIDRGWSQCDFVYVIGDAYVDHPSFGHAIISRILERHGYSVGIISQPDWKNPKSIDIYGRPRLGFLVSGGNMDSMVNHYSVTKHRRKTDAFTPGGEMGKRPDYATVVYCNLIRQVYKDVPILIGGIEASLRRLGHYDYWSESMKRSILLDSQADKFFMRFEGGKVVESGAEVGAELLETMLNMDEGARYLGECALVPQTSPINRTDLLFYNTLFDENAVCHLAVGRGFNDTIRDCHNKTNDECRQLGINDSMVHEDFMIGCDSMNIDAVCADGRIVPIFRAGNGAF